MRQHSEFMLGMTKWITSAGLPFDTMENAISKQTLHLLDPNVRIQGRSQTTRNIFRLHDALQREAKICIQVRELLRENTFLILC